jgi:hypothetical protein
MFNSPSYRTKDENMSTKKNSIKDIKSLTQKINTYEMSEEWKTGNTR